MINFFVTLVLLSPFILFLIKTIRKRKPAENEGKLPPSPPGLPVIGHLHLLGGDLPHRALGKVYKNHGDIVYLKLGETSAVIVSSRELAKDVMKVHDLHFADRPNSISVEILWYNYSDLAFCPYGEEWRQMRKICMVEMLSPKNVKSFGYIREDEITTLVKTLRASSGESVDFTETISSFNCSITCRAALGKVLGDRDTLIPLIKTAVGMSGGFELADLFPSFKLLHLFSVRKYKLLGMRRKIDVILDRMVEEHKVKKSGEYDGEDIVDVLLRMQETGELKFPITTENIKAIILDMFAAGTETVSTSMDWIMTELMRHPRVMAKLQEEIRGALRGKTRLEESDVQELKYMKLVIKETMRLHPPVPIIPRQCREECQIGGYSIPLKTRLIVNVWSLGRDPKYWNDPETFLPERFEDSSIDLLGHDFEFLPFGSGRRICPGLNFGLANVQFPLAQLLYNFDWKLPNGMKPSDVDMSELDGLAVGRKTPLVLVPTPYNPSY
ncbi:hypothetical protein ACS0TY_012277 [Phlomoides rotata]